MIDKLNYTPYNEQLNDKPPAVELLVYKLNEVIEVVNLLTRSDEITELAQESDTFLDLKPVGKVNFLDLEATAVEQAVKAERERIVRELESEQLITGGSFEQVRTYNRAIKDAIKIVRAD